MAVVRIGRAIWYMHQELCKGVITVGDVGRVVGRCVMGSYERDT